MKFAHPKVPLQLTLVDETNEIIQAAKTKQDIEKAKAVRKYAVIVLDNAEEGIVNFKKILQTIEKILKELHSSGDNFIAELINSNKGFYSIETINSNLTVKRKQSSDFIDISFKSSDPGVAVWTVRLLSETFISKFKYLKGSETVNVVKWFETRLQEAAADLNNSEDKLKDFGVKNKIIEYVERVPKEVRKVASVKFGENKGNI